MKKVLWAGVVVVLGVGLYFVLAPRLRKAFGPGSAELRAFQRDELSVPAAEPEVAVLVNGGERAAVWAGGPLYVTVAVAHRHGSNLVARRRMLEARMGKESEEGKKELQKAVSKMAEAGVLDLGGGWPEAVELRLKRAGTGEGVKWQGKRVGAAPGTKVDGESAVELTVVPAVPAPGVYAVEACLGSAGMWKGKVCGAPAELRVVAGPDELEARERVLVGRQGLRLAFLQRDWGRLEGLAKGILEKDPVEARIGLGDAYYGQERWAEALEQYTAARRARGGRERTGLDGRISELVKRLGGEEE